MSYAAELKEHHFLFLFSPLKLTACNAGSCDSSIIKIGYIIQADEYSSFKLECNVCFGLHRLQVGKFDLAPLQLASLSADVDEPEVDFVDEEGVLEYARRRHPNAQDVLLNERVFFGLFSHVATI